MNAKDNFHHGFSDEEPVEQILRWFCGIKMKDKSLPELWREIDEAYIRLRSQLQPTYASFSSIHLANKIYYLRQRVLALPHWTKAERNEVEDIIKAKARREAIKEIAKAYRDQDSSVVMFNFKKLEKSFKVKAKGNNIDLLLDQLNELLHASEALYAGGRRRFEGFDYRIPEFNNVWASEGLIKNVRNIIEQLKYLQSKL
jgi:hypothetical protein